MIQVATGYTEFDGEKHAAIDLFEQLESGLGGSAADAVILFVSPKYRYQEFLSAFQQASGAKIVVGCSSAGEFILGKNGENAISAMALRSDEMSFSASLATGLREDRDQAASALGASLGGDRTHSYRYRSLLVLTDALAGHTDDFIERLNTATGGGYQIFGGGAGENAKFETTHVFCGTRAETDAAVALEILSHKPLGIGVQHGWAPVGKPMKVTEAEGVKLVSLNAIRAVEMIEDYARETGQEFDRGNPVPFFLHNVLGIEAEGGYKLRVPLAVQEDGSLICASDLPVGSTVVIMTATGKTPADAASTAVQSALRQIEGFKPQAALFFDCVATRLRLGKEFGSELNALAESLGETVLYSGCNTYGQIARVEGQFSGFHNCTAVVCVIPA